jgi:energy-converting hydrogenase Eha subunit H
VIHLSAVVFKGKDMRTINLQNISLNIMYITTIIAASIVLAIIITELGNFRIAHGQVNITALTPQQKAAICDPNDKSINATESKICGVPVTVQPHSNSSNMTTGA